MATPAHILCDILLQRLRDKEGITHPRATVFKILTAVQRAVNERKKLVLATLPLTTKAYQVFYPVTPNLANTIDIAAVHDENGLDLHFVDWHTFWYTDRGWHRRTADQFRLYSKVGREILMVWPAKQVDATVNVVTVVKTDDLDEEVSIQLPDETFAVIEDFAEVILSVMGRNFNPIKSVIDGMAERLKVLD